MVLKELKEIYIWVRGSLYGIGDICNKFNIQESEIKRFIYSKEKIYPRSKFTVSQALTIWYEVYLGKPLKDVAKYFSISMCKIKNLMNFMDNNENVKVKPELTQTQIMEIVNYRKDCYSYAEIASMYDTSINNIKRVLEPYMSELPRHIGGRRTQITDDDIILMNKLRDNGYSYSQIAKKINRAISTVFNYINNNGGSINV